MVPAAYVEGAGAQFLEWSQTFASRPNQTRVLDEHLAARGDPSTHDTAGHSRGCIVLRWVGTAEPSDPVCRVVRHTDIARD